MQEYVDMTGELALTELLGYLMDGKSVMVTATGYSMMPTFHPGVDKILLSPCNRQELKEGDVVFFNRKDAVCVHRIIWRRGDSLVIRGDGNAHNAYEKATLKDVFALVTGGTMRGGRPFDIKDRRWEKNTDFVMKHHKALSVWNRFRRIVRSYPISISAVMVLMFLSLFNPGDTHITDMENADKYAHVLMYLCVGLTFWYEWIRSHRNAAPRVLRGVAFCVIFPMILGGLLEIGQEYLTECRNGDWLDFAANCLGCLVASALSLGVMQPLIRRKK